LFVRRLIAQPSLILVPRAIQGWGELSARRAD
jgi:hypothetical protein